jgi:hypothetical protein
MSHGFDTLKDIVQVLIIPVVIFAAGAFLPRMLEGQRRRAFLSLIRRELTEMEPWPKERSAEGKWPQHLKKRFVHQSIFANPSQNRDFILSLPADLVYHEAQLWLHFEKATFAMDDKDVAEHGARWCDYLKWVCNDLGGRGRGDFTKSVYEPWERLVLAYHGPRGPR